MKSSVERTMRFETLDSLRGLAALCVALAHMRINSFFTGVSFVENGYLFVDFFFVLSGFVICHSFANRLTTSLGVIDFLITRFGRLYPLHLATLLFFAIISLNVILDFNSDFWHSEGETTVGNVALQLALMHSFGLNNALIWNFPSWSVAAEFWSYALFAILVFASKRLLIFSSIIVCSASLVFVLRHETINITADGGFLRGFLGFFIGVLTYQFYVWTTQFSLEKRNLVVSHFVEIAAVGLILLFVTIAGKSKLSFAAPAIFALCVFIFAHGSGMISWFLRLAPFQFLGRISYSIYLLHIPLMLIFLRFAINLFDQFVPNSVNRVDENVMFLQSPALGTIAVCLLLGITIVASNFSYRLIELPGINVSKKIVEARRIKKAALESAA